MVPIPSIGVNICVIKSGKILLTRREDFEVWCLPGGSVDPGETICQAALREVNVETGLIVEISHFVGIYWRANCGIHVVSLYVRPIGGGMDPDPSEVIEMDYFLPRKLPKEHNPWHKQRIFDVCLNRTGAEWSQDNDWSFEDGMSLDEIYSLRDKSGLNKKDLFYRYMVDSNDDQTSELEGQAVAQGVWEKSEGIQ